MLQSGFLGFYGRQSFNRKRKKSGRPAGHKNDTTLEAFDHILDGTLPGTGPEFGSDITHGAFRYPVKTQGMQAIAQAKIRVLI
jgi:hypothetical protein